MKRKPKEKLTALIFAVYLLIVFLLLFGRPRGSSGISYEELLRTNFNAVPLKTITRYVRALLNGRYIRTALTNLFGNILLFVPFGVLVPKISAKHRKFAPFLLFQTKIILLAEMIQLLTLLGVCDIDDVILNTLGGVSGYAIFRLTQRHIKSEK